ncbi:hypothetical protein [Streptomyces sp. PTD5-9]|uniref:hypothetical protein n=1 Tax=Streptomyces sp. PTD5-9 TaxID=3120150 RepID=UPI003008038A
MQYLTQSRIAAALAAATQPAGERPWALLLTKPPATYTEARQRIALGRNPGSRELAGIDEPTARAEASRARIINDLARRDAYMAALSVSEQMVSTTPVLPTSVVVEMAEWHDGPLITWFFSRDAAAVRSFAAHVAAPVTEAPNGDGSARTYVSAIGAVNGVRVVAYTLVDTAAGQVAA